MQDSDFASVPSMSMLAQAKRRYWAWSAYLRRVRLLLNEHRRPFAREVLRTQWRHVTGTRAAGPFDPDAALSAAIAWLLRAQAATSDDGVSLGYFPCDWELGWRPSYPETTGYIIPTLLEYAALRRDESISRRALAAAHWETRIQMPSGGVQGGPVCSPAQQKEAVFNTGMVLQGWAAALCIHPDPLLMTAARRAADFLVQDMDSDGHFRTHGTFVAADRIKTYNVLCAWSLIRFAQQTKDARYSDAAERNAEAALSEQRANGWFDNNDLVDATRPLTHTIGYTLQGLLEVGVCSGRQDFIDAALRGIEPVIPHVRNDGYLAGRFDSDWRPASPSSCLTGSAQLAIVLYRLFELRGNVAHRDIADRLVDFLMSVQNLDSGDVNINGAIAGSFPLLGSYMTAGYPNWATKYYADALMVRARLRATNPESSELAMAK